MENSEWKFYYSTDTKKHYTYRQVDEKEWEFKSNSSFGKSYFTKLNGNVNNKERSFTLSCNCPPWIFNHGKNGKKRWCEHCRIILNEELNFTEQVDVMEKRDRLYDDVEVW